MTLIPAHLKLARGPNCHGRTHCNGTVSWYQGTKVPLASGARERLVAGPGRRRPFVLERHASLVGRLSVSSVVDFLCLSQISNQLNPARHILPLAAATAAAAAVAAGARPSSSVLPRLPQLPTTFPPEPKGVHSVAHRIACPRDPNSRSADLPLAPLGRQRSRHLGAHNKKIPDSHPPPSSSSHDPVITLLSRCVCERAPAPVCVCQRQRERLTDYLGKDFLHSHNHHDSRLG